MSICLHIHYLSNCFSSPSARPDASQSKCEIIVNSENKVFPQKMQDGTIQNVNGEESLIFEIDYEQGMFIHLFIYLSFHWIIYSKFIGKWKKLRKRVLFHPNQQ